MMAHLTDQGSIDSVIKFLQSQKEVLGKQERDIEVERLNLYKEIELLESAFAAEESKRKMLSAKLTELDGSYGLNSQRNPPTHQIGKHQRTRSDLQGQITIGVSLLLSR